MLIVRKPGLQSTLQGAPRIGYRHLGIPHAGPADELSMALANRLVENASRETCLEITYGGFEAELTADCALAVTGACEFLEVSGQAAPVHETLRLKVGDRLCIPSSAVGMRTYLAIHSGFAANLLFGSTSTYLPAGFGGFQGRALRAGDVLVANRESGANADHKTPLKLRPRYSHASALRTCISAEYDRLSSADQERLFSTKFTIGRQATRMGIPLMGNAMVPRSDDMMRSAPVFPGTIQCPSSGNPILLSNDAQTTGGYPRIANIARCDRHLIGQLRPGDTVQFLKRSVDDACVELEAKRTLFESWLNA
ncbi:MAG: biotin-dependent carboxyltransferase family protein [Pseudomonadota bacterium]